MSDEKPTCGECKHYQRLRFSPCRECTCDAPQWAYGGEEGPSLPRRMDAGENAENCECFERKDAK